MYVRFEPNRVVLGIGKDEILFTTDEARNLSSMFKEAAEKSVEPMPEDPMKQFIEFDSDLR